MNFDRNTVLGFVALGILFFGYFYFNNQQQQAYKVEQARKDSILLAGRPKPDPKAMLKDSLSTDSLLKIVNVEGFKQSASQEEELTILENDLMKVVFTNKGGQPKAVELKNFQNQNSKTVKLAATDYDKITYAINTASNKSAQIEDLYFDFAGIQKLADGSQVISFDLLAQDSVTKLISHQFVIKKDQYLFDFNLQLNGADKLLTQNSLNLIWQTKANKLEKDLAYEKMQTQVAYVTDEEFDYHTVGNGDDKEFKKPTNWIAVKQQFFSRVLIAKNNFSSGTMIWEVPGETDTVSVVKATANMKIEGLAGSLVSIPFSLYYGPNDYKVLKSYNLEMENLVNLGQGVFAFVKYINRYIILPFFDLFKSLIGNYGIVILLMTVCIRLIISPLTYSSYLSGAKMKMLRPEIQKLKDKHGADQQAISMEQMKLFREAGVNPLGGCIPALLQIPIFFALYSFFNSNVGLRGEGFLWSKDLSAYDSILDLGFNIPFYGDHVSLFTILAVITSFLISIYSMNMAPDQSNPMMKYMPYIFPFFMLFIFNKMPSALTWYYTVSNVITLIIQFVIMNYIIDHDKVLAKIELERKKPKTKSKWQEKLEQVQESQKKVKEMQQKSKK
jgi:YidC/Oxa1 family membrane protein insertase